MLIPLFHNVGGTWTIYSVGDGLFMKRVLDGVAAMSNSGLFLSLGALGLMLGLFIVAFQHVVSNGQKLEVGSLLVAFVMFCIFFGMRTNVVIEDLGGAPGSVQNGVYAVDNVPFGLAVAGSLVSTVGLTLSEKMSQGYGLPGGPADENGVSGFGRSLEWINAVRNWELPEFAGSGSGDVVSRFKRNVTDYVANCTLVGADNGKIDLPRAFQAADPFQMGSTSGGGIGYDNMYATTKWQNPDGSIGDKDCASAMTDLASDAHGNALFSAFANAAAPRMKRLAPGVPADTQMMDAFADLGISGDKAADYMAASAVNAVWTMALRKGSDPSGMDVMSQVMINQGTEQRATQWGADESMFRQVMRPTAAFFESMIYAMAPFMALMIGLGPWGIRKMGQYMILTIWVALWQPVLAVVNLFQMTMVEHAVVAMSQVPPGATPLAMTSLAGAANLQHQIVNWIATGATIAAATPAITMMLIFGGAVAATSLSGRLQGAEFSNEKLATPDIAKDAPVMEMKSMQTHSQTAGTHVTGADKVQPTFSGSEVSEQAISSTSSALQSASTTMTAQNAKAIQAGITNREGVTVSGGSAISSTATQNQQEAANFIKSQGMTIGANQEAAWAAVMAITAQGGVDAGLSAAKGLGLNMGAGARGSSSFSEKDARTLLESVRNEVSRGGSFSATLAKASTDSVNQMASNGSESVQSVMGSKSFQAARSDMQQKQDAYQEAVSSRGSFNMGQTLGSLESAHLIQKSGHGAEVVAKAQELAGADAMRDAQHMVDNAPWGSSDAGERRIQAAQLALKGSDLPDQSVLRPGTDTDRQVALMQSLRYAGGAFGGAVNAAATGNARANEGLASDVHQGEATTAVNRARPGTDATEGSISGRASAFLSGDTAGAWSAVANKAGVGDVEALLGSKQTLDEFRQNPSSGALLTQVDGYHDQHLQEQKEAGKPVREANTSRALENDTGGFARAFKTGYNDLGQAVKNNSPLSIGASLAAARSAANGVPAGQIEQSLKGYNEESTRFLGMSMASNGLGPMAGLAVANLAEHGISLTGLHGTTESSMLAAATDQKEGARINSAFQERLASLQASDGAYQSPALVTARAVADTIYAKHGATPEMAKAYDQAYANLSDNEKTYFTSYVGVSNNSNIGGGIGDMSSAQSRAGLNPDGLVNPMAAHPLPGTTEGANGAGN
ncbi:conjugal transfer protein TraG N-terminal domain-containing protein [Rhodanobacter denitrificans]|uniref:conjugal transfer protein TraG N-terminal domain-containing protein n=1 Tax=Rhodanobacter denitrificans TaxID=666685 RepID=UPI001F233398|nr:conjugal transfer protein TraG N-terminal domain-containing protein [Rhodanobacter denitrificans]UJJ60583.1 conjugal transfer protein TraG N-terminal domain-containing protein [Rhodanobacter denitrificans]